MSKILVVFMFSVFSSLLYAVEMGEVSATSGSAQESCCQVCPTDNINSCNHNKNATTEREVASEKKKKGTRTKGE